MDLKARARTADDRVAGCARPVHGDGVTFDDARAQPEVVYVLPNKLGGVFSYVHQSVVASPAGRVPLRRGQDAERATSAIATIDEPLGGRSGGAVRLPPAERRMFTPCCAGSRRAIPYGPGVVVANDWIELALTSIHDTGRAVFAINHGDLDFYYDLAVRHQRHDRRVRHLHRADGPAAARAAARPRRTRFFCCPTASIFPRTVRRTAAGTSCGVLYVGRLSEDKGVFDLPFIDRRLRELGVDPVWTVQGAGPDEEALRAAWADRPGHPVVRTARQGRRVAAVRATRTSW